MLSVNTNVLSLNAQRNLTISGNLMAKSLERLSSGLRINRAADDAAGLAISESLRSQIRGMGQAVRNANDGISMISTAESSMVETTNMLQRMRELAIQSANDTNSVKNRAVLQNEVDQLLAEITRVANTVQFNGLNLLDGTFSNKKLQVGAAANQTISLSIGDLRATSLGQVAIVTSTGATGALTAGALEINGTDIGSTASDGISFAGGTYSAIAMTTAINAKSATTGVYAEVIDTVKTSGGAVAGGTIAAGNFAINNVSIGAVTILANDSSGTLRDAINAVSNSSGVTATIAAGNELVLTAEDGRNITIASTAADVVKTGLIAADSAATFSGTYTLTSDTAFSLSGTDEAAAGFLADASVAIDATTAISNVDITTTTGANSAISRVDAALSQLSDERSQLGAYTNRLDSTINNLRTISENLAAADQRIRDADFAAETANLTKAQILQQAGVAILAQANVSSQAALSLLG
jgi:flagellin